MCDGSETRVSDCTINKVPIGINLGAPQALVRCFQQTGTYIQLLHIAMYVRCIRCMWFLSPCKREQLNFLISRLSLPYYLILPCHIGLRLGYIKDIVYITVGWFFILLRNAIFPTFTFTNINVCVYCNTVQGQSSRTHNLAGQIMSTIIVKIPTVLCANSSYYLAA